MAQQGGSCPLTLDEQLASIHAFEPIASFLTHEPRCFNCHGGVNPFISDTGTDPADETAPASSVAHGGGLIRRQRERAPDGTLLIEGECAECHNGMAPKRDGSKSRWFLAPNFLSFVGKDAPTLCKQMKRSTQTAEHFLGHLEDDNGGNNFGGTAFMGNRGLDPEVYEIAPAPPSISHASLMRLATDWVQAMNNAFQGDEGCGCEPEIALAIEHRVVTRRDTSHARVGRPLYDGTVRFEVTLHALPTLPGEFRGETTVVRQFSVGHIKQCSGEGTQAEKWRVAATLDPEAETLKVRLAMYPDGMSAWWVCDGRRSEVTTPLVSELRVSGPTLSMAMRSGSRQSIAPRGALFDETLTLTVPEPRN